MSLESKLSEATSQVSTLTFQVDQEKSAKMKMQADLDQAKSELSKALSVKSDMEQKLAASEATLKEVDKRMKEMENLLKETEKKRAILERKVKTLEDNAQDVELGKIVVSPEGTKSAGAPAGKQLEGRVLIVNKDFKFAVLNLGAKDGIDVGMVFSVFHNNKNIGELKVERVHETMAAAGFVQPDLKDKVSEGVS